MRGLLSGSQLTGGKRVSLIRKSPSILIGIFNDIGSHSGIIAHRTEHKIMGRGKRICMACPRRFRISAKTRYLRVAESAIPPSHCIERHMKARFHSNFFQGFQMLCTVHQFVFQLNSDDISAILIQKSLNLFINFLIPNSSFGKIAFIVVPEAVRLFQQPVRKPAVSALSVGPRGQSAG